MIADHRIHARFPGREHGPGLGGLCLRLLESQQRTWPDLAEAYESLTRVKTRDIACTGFSVRLMHNPGRMRSSTAPVAEADVQARPCFLCPRHLPAPQEAILYREEYLILCNPMPVFPGHLTVSHVEHRPQAVAGQFFVMLRLAADLGEDWTVLYNGPRCGASAPDHLHFQVMPKGRMPIEGEMEEGERIEPLAAFDDMPVCTLKDMGRLVLLLKGDDMAALSAALETLVATLRSRIGIDEEPMMNLAAFHRNGRWRILLFPRSKHRPDVFFREGAGRIVVSPAIVEMGGVIVTPVEGDFERLDRDGIEAIYREVSPAALPGFTSSPAPLKL